MMHLAALLALGTAAPQAQPPAGMVQMQPAPDATERRKDLRTLVMCIAKARPLWARQTLAKPYLSDAQASQAAEALYGRDNCMTKPEADLTFRTSTLVGTLAEHFLQARMDQSTGSNMATALNKATALNASEDFALCVAARDPDAARGLALSEPGSSAETGSARELTSHVPSCTTQGEKLTLDVQAFRALIATALYRAMTIDLAAR
jgi:hypothetical protein